MEQNKRIEHLASHDTELKREIGVFGGVSIVGGIMIGSGIFYIGSYVLERTGMSLGLSLLAWILGGIVSLLGGFCFAELGASMPRAGGSTVYLNEAYHPIAGFLRGFTDWIIGGPGSIAAIAIALPTAMQSFFSIGELEIKLIAVAIIIGLTIINLFGVKSGSTLQNYSMVAKLVPIAIIMFAALFLGKESPSITFKPLGDQAVSLTQMIKMVSFATIASLWAYEGWSNINSMAEEMRDPSKDLPRALLIGIGSITLLYTLFNFAIFRAVPYNEIVSSIEAGDLYLGTKAALLTLGKAGGVIVSIGMIVSMFGGLNGLIIAQPRMYYGMAVEGLFFKSFKKVHPKYKVPHVVLIVQAVLSIILVFSRNLDQLTSLVVFTGMIFNLLVVGSVIILRRKYPDLPRPFKTFGYPFTIWITLLLFGGLMLNSLIEDPTNSLLGLLVQAIGVGFYFFFTKNAKPDKSEE